MTRVGYRSYENSVGNASSLRAGSPLSNRTTAHIWPGDPSLHQVYGPATRTLAAGFISYGLHVRVIETAVKDSAMRPGLLRVLHSSVRPGDLFVSISRSVQGVPWQWLRSKGVYRVSYSTDLGMCRQLRGREELIDELWSYTRADLEICKEVLPGTPLRAVPPGFVPPRVEMQAQCAGCSLGAWDRLQSAASGSELDEGAAPEPVFFLGSAKPVKRARCLATLNATTFASSLMVKVVWRKDQLAKLINAHSFALNIHRECGACDASAARKTPDGDARFFQCLKHTPVEFFRLADLLSAGVHVVSEMGHPDDMVSLKGIVSFARTLGDMPRVFHEAVRAERQAPTGAHSQLGASMDGHMGWRTRSMLRIQHAYIARFQPAVLLRKAGFGELLTSPT